MVIILPKDLCYETYYFFLYGTLAVSPAVLPVYQGAGAACVRRGNNVQCVVFIDFILGVKP